MSMRRSDLQGSTELDSKPLPVLDELVNEFWKLLELEIGLHKIYLDVVDGASTLKFSDARILEVIDDSRTRQFDVVQKISRINTADIDHLKAKAKILLAYFSSEEGDAQSDLVRSVIQDLINMPLRAGTAPMQTIQMRPSKKRSAISEMAALKGRLNEAPPSQS